MRPHKAKLASRHHLVQALSCSSLLPGVSSPPHNYGNSTLHRLTTKFHVTICRNRGFYTSFRLLFAYNASHAPRQTRPPEDPRISKHTLPALRPQHHARRENARGYGAPGMPSVQEQIYPG